MSDGTSTPRSRRAVLGAAAAATAASIISAIDRPSIVRAGSDGDVVLGAGNIATATTSISAEWGSGAIPLVLRADDNRAPALRTVGRIQFVDRSGRATVVKGKRSADVDFRYPSEIGLEGTPLCFANVMSYRPGVFVTMVRPNYPVRNKMRIYLNRAVTSNTLVAWLVLN